MYLGHLGPGIPLQKASISELFRLPLEDLLVRLEMSSGDILSTKKTSKHVNMPQSHADSFACDISWHITNSYIKYYKIYRFLQIWSNMQISSPHIPSIAATQPQQILQRDLFVPSPCWFRWEISTTNTRPAAVVKNHLWKHTRRKVVRSTRHHGKELKPSRLSQWCQWCREHHLRWSLASLKGSWFQSLDKQCWNLKVVWGDDTLSYYIYMVVVRW